MYCIIYCVCLIAAIIDSQSIICLYKEQNLVRDLVELFNEYKKCKTDEMIHGIMCMKRKIPYSVAIDTIRKYIKK